MRKGGDAADFGVNRPAAGLSGPLFEQEPQERVFARSKIKPTTMEIAIGSLIWDHRGWKNAISIARIIEVVGIQGLDERAVKETVAELVKTHRCMIGGYRGDGAHGGGYFWIIDAEDLERAVRPFRNQMIEMGKRLRVLMSKADYRELVGQLSLAEGDECD
jgi:hypothetical protein